MRVRTRPAGLLVTASMVLVGIVLLAAAGVAVAASASPSPSAAEKAPLVNWGWLAFGLGGVVILLVVMFLLTRVFRSARREEK
jgi:hypothetical protein